MPTRHLIAIMSATTWSVSGVAQSPIPATPLVNQITDEGFNHSQVTNIAEDLADHIGARVTNSLAMRHAETWAMERLAGFGLTAVHREGFEFGRGWQWRHAHVSMLDPRPLDLHVVPVAWTPGTNGPVEGSVIMAPLTSDSDFAAWRGKLRNRIVLVSAASDPNDEARPSFYRIKESDLADHSGFQPPAYEPTVRAQRIASDRFAVARDAFLKQEGALTWVRTSRDEDGLLSGEGYQFRSGHTPAVPGLQMAAEDCRRLARLASTAPVSLRIDTNVAFSDDDTRAYNILADIPGRSKGNGYVMAGAHLDSWAAGDGATDNGAGVAVVMEAARILSALHLQPRRTIRFAFWTGEEQGLLGSYAYVARHLATRPSDSKDDKRRFGPGDTLTWPITPLVGYADLAAYFNIDNGAGCIRGIFAAGNLAAIPKLTAWLSPFASMGAASVLASRNDGSDQQAFAEVGLPAFQFVQDPLDYRFVHHTQLDTFDHVRPDDLRQSAIILATVLLEAANADEPLPRTPIPTTPTLPSAFERR